MVVLWLAIAGAAGAPARYLLDGVIQDRVDGVFPYGTLVVNLTGSFVLGVVTGLVLYHALPSVPATALGTGFCGAYTTFSTFTFESIRLMEEGEWREACRNVVLSAGAGLLAAGLGLAVASL